MKWIRRKYQTGDCRNFDLIIAATSKKDINRQVSTEAQQLHIPVNVIDDPELCTVIFSAVWNDGPLSVAVSSSGVAPFLAAEIRNRIASEGKEWGRRVEIAGRFRDVVRKEVEDSKERTELYKRFIDACVSDKTTEPSYNDSLREWLDWLE